MISLKFNKPTLVLPKLGDKLVIEFITADASRHFECEGIYVLRQMISQNTSFEDLVDEIAPGSIIYPNSGEFTIKNDQLSFLSIVLRRSVELDTDDEVLDMRNAKDVMIKIHSKKETEAPPVIKGFSGEISYDKRFTKYSTKHCYQVGSRIKMDTHWEQFPDELHHFIKIQTTDYDRMYGRQITQFGVCEIEVMNENDRFIIEPLGYDYKMDTIYPVKTSMAGDMKVLENLKMFINNP